MNTRIKLNLVGYWRFYLENCTTNFDVASGGVRKFPNNSSGVVGQLRQLKLFEILREGARALKIG